MPLRTAEALVDALRGRPLLTPEQFGELTSKHAPAHPDPQDLARALIRLRWMTVYQAKKLLSGNGDELFVSQYLILDKLGEGGMGKVYKAIQMNLAREVALKVIRSNLLKSETATKRFRREVKAAGALNHPNIVRVFDAEQTGNRHYLAMEYIPGSDMANLVRNRGPLPIPIACSYVRQAALGLQHAHERGMVHRDIKPSNLLVAVGEGGQYTARGPVKILDMGLARMQDTPAEDSSSTELTQTGTVVGTPDFMSPEQAKNSSQVDHRSDLYSLGCTFYYLLTGDVPFPNGSALEKLLQHQMDAPRPVQLLRMDVPAQVAAIVQTLLEKKPDRRFQSGAALANALEPWCDSKGAGVPASAAVPVAEAVDPSSAAIETPPGDPFDFTGEDPDPVTPIHIRKSPTDRLSAQHRIPTPWIIGLAALFLVFLVGGAVTVGLLTRNTKKTEPMPPKSSHSEPPPRAEVPPKPDPAPARELESVEKYLPNTSSVVAVADVHLWHSVPAARQYLLEPLGRKLADLSKVTGTDLTTAIERIVLAVAGKDEGQMFIAQGKGLVTPRLIDRLKALQGVAAEPAWDGGPELLILPASEGGSRQYVGFTETSALLSGDRALVVDGLRKRDGTVRTQLADETLSKGLGVANLRPSAVFVALGCRSELAKSVVALNSLNAAAAGIHFEDWGMVFGVMALEGVAGKATEARNALGTALQERAKAGPEPDRRLERLARLLLDSEWRPFIKRQGFHSGTFVPTRQLGEWFEDFWQK
jgi:eukaryotic-like serine/threonine-protein kinase